VKVDEIGHGLNPHHSHSMVDGGLELMSRRMSRPADHRPTYAPSALR
jgi:hypothetical protein